jgi:multidrug resistance protein, MATE family
VFIAIFDGGNSVDPNIGAEMQQIARNFLLITGLWLIPDVFFNTYMHTLKALGDSRFVSIVICVAVMTLVALPSVLLSQLQYDWVKYLVYSLIILYVLVLWLIFGLRYRGGKWKDHHVID